LTPPQQLVLGRTAAFLAVAGVPMGVELRPFDAGTPPGVPPPRVKEYPVVPPGLPQPGRTIKESLDGFVAANPGYEWIADGQVTRARPVGTVTDSANWLNALVETFDIRDQAMVEALTAFGRLFDPAYDDSRVLGGREGGVPGPPGARLTAIEEAKAHRFSVLVAKTTVRGVLDAIVLGHGAAGWLVSFRGTAPTFANSRVEIVFWKGASVLALPVAPPARALRTDATTPMLVPLPLTFKTMRLALNSLAVKETKVMGFLLGRECAANEPTRMLDLSGLTLAEAVPLVLSHCPGYESQTVNGVLTVAPPGALERDRVLTTRLRVFGVANMPAWGALDALRRTLFREAPRSPAGRPMSPMPAVRDSQMKPVSVKLDKPTVRQVLDALVTAHGALTWVCEPASDNGPMRLSLEGSGWSVSISFGRLPR
jgi:hypothetical protein